MKKILAISVLMNVALVFGLGLACREWTAHAAAGGGAGVPVGNGDVNGDGSINISDAIYTLSWLFTGGPAPVAIECPPPPENGLPATGQTKCFTDQGADRVCADTAFPGQDGFYQAGCSSKGRFVDNGDGTVTDNCTGLMWQKDPDADPVSWQKALEYCSELDLAGHEDWRLPNIRELHSIMDYGRFRPAIDPMFGVKSEQRFWSSTSLPFVPLAIAYAWTVEFELGNVSLGEKNGFEQFAVRAVRSIP